MTTTDLTEAALRQTLRSVKDVDIEIVWEPYWSPEKIGPKVRAMMGF